MTSGKFQNLFLPEYGKHVMSVFQEIHTPHGICCALQMVFYCV